MGTKMSAVGWVEPRLVAARPTTQAVAIGGPRDAEHRSTHPDMVGPVKPPHAVFFRLALGWEWSKIVPTPRPSPGIAATNRGSFIIGFVFVGYSLGGFLLERAKGTGRVGLRYDG